MNEIWKDIDGYEGLYQVSNLGRVKSINYRGNTKEEKILLPHITKLHYVEIELSGKIYKVHRIVANAFLPNPNNLPEINHKNRIRWDNIIDNLELVNHEENVIYSLGKPVICLNINTQEKMLFSTTKEAGNYFNVTSSAIRNSIYRNTLFHNEYKFYYK